MNIRWRTATSGDIPTIADWNHQLIRDEGHRNPMTPAELSVRMESWLAREYQAIIFLKGADPIGYALFRQEPDLIYLRQFFIRRDSRRFGCGRAGFHLLREEVWPKGIRLTVEVLAHNSAAIAFWKRLGFADYSQMLEIMPSSAR